MSGKSLREWYHHDADRFDEFAARYKGELRDSSDLDISQAAVLAELLEGSSH